jgi:hypothetical protein
VGVDTAIDALAGLGAVDDLAGFDDLAGLGTSAGESKVVSKVVRRSSSSSRVVSMLSILSINLAARSLSNRGSVSLFCNSTLSCSSFCAPLRIERTSELLARRDFRTVACAAI